MTKDSVIIVLDFGALDIGETVKRPVAVAVIHAGLQGHR